MPRPASPPLCRLLPVAGLAGVLALGAAATASAQNGDLMRLADRDRDGAISVAEARMALSAQYDLMDRNGDGVVSRAEFLHFRLARLAQFDLDGDGRITRFELRRHFLATIRR